MYFSSYSQIGFRAFLSIPLDMVSYLDGEVILTLKSIAEPLQPTGQENLSVLDLDRWMRFTPLSTLAPT